MAAALLTGGASVMPVFAEAKVKTYAELKSSAKMANGSKFYLKTTTGFYKAVEVELKNGKKVCTLEETADANKKEIFTVSNLQAIGGQYTFSLSDSKGHAIYLDATGAVDGNKTVEESKIVSTFITTTNELKSLSGFSASLKNATDITASLATEVETIDAEMLNEYNMEGFTFGFNAKTDLVGNSFSQPIYAVQVVAGGSIDAGTYFVVDGTEKALKALKEDFKDGSLDTETNLANKDIKVIALNKDKKYSIKAAESVAYSLQVVAGDKLNENEAAFTVTEFDKLANAGEYELKIADPAGSANPLYIGAIQYTPTDTKTYVTTVTASEKHQLIPATLGASTYLDASVLLKENAVNYVNVYFTSSKESQKDGFQTEYHKYLVPTVKSSSFVYAANAADDLNAHSAAQWAVADFDGKYSFTLVNRETKQAIKLGLQESEVKGEYKLVAATENGTAVSFSDLETSSDDNTPKPIAGTTVKFIPVEKEAGYLNLTKEEMEAGVKLSFTGKTALIGEKTFYAAEGDNNALVSSMDAADAFKFNVAKAEGKINAADKDEVADYTIQEIEVAYLKDGKVTTAKDTLFVPTYNLFYTVEVNGEDVNYYLDKTLKFAKLASETDKPAEFVFRANANGSYAMLATDADVRFDDDIKAEAKAVGVNTATGKTLDVEAADFYNVAGDDFAYVTVAVQDNSDKTTLAAEPRHASFDNILGSINFQLNANSINEGVLGETMTFWLDTADSKAVTPSFYISRGVVAEGDSVPSYRMFMYNASDSLSIFDEGSAQATLNEKYQLEGTSKIAKVIFRQAEIAGIDTIATSVNGEAVKVAAKEDKAAGILGGVDNFKFGIRLADEAVADEYVIYSKADNKYVYALNGKLGLTASEKEAMVFTLGDEVPTSNESVEDAVAVVKVSTGNGTVTVQGAAGKKVVITNVLGKVIASTVLTSDNATFNAPAGIVAVAVEGEEAVKAVVK